MASMKLPPRQKMINMMYLVLTAILALNVSKEVLDGFVLVDEGLKAGTTTRNADSRQQFDRLQRFAADFPAKASVAFAKAGAVHVTADSLVAYIDRMKALTIAETDGKEMNKIVGRNEAGEDTVLRLALLERKDVFDPATYLLVGSEPATPRDGAHTAKELRGKLDAFRQQLKQTLGEKSPALTASLDHVFDFSDRRDASGVMQNWESYNFYNVPAAACIAQLSRMQKDVRDAEGDVLKWLYASVDGETIAVTTLAPAVIPMSNYVMLGDSFRADVFLAAYDDRNLPTIELARDGATVDTVNMRINGEKDVLHIGADGKGKLALKAGTVGQQRRSGIIHFKGPKGDEPFLFEANYEVAAPALVASPTKMNVLYRGVDNPIDVSVPGVSADRIRPGITNGTMHSAGSGFVARVSTGNEALLTVSATMPDGSVRAFGPSKFRVKNLPPPSPSVSQKGPEDSKINADDLKRARFMVVRLKDSEFDAPFKATRFVVTFIRGAGAPIVKVVSGNEFPKEVTDMFGLVRPGDRIFFEEIKARLASGEGIEYKLPAIALKVM